MDSVLIKPVTEEAKKGASPDAGPAFSAKFRWGKASIDPKQPYITAYWAFQVFTTAVFRTNRHPS